MSVLVGIVTFNRKKMLQETLESLLNQTVEISKIIIVDNNSSDGTEKMIELEYKANDFIEYHKLSENTGGAGGFSKVVEIAEQNHYEWLWLMDDDVLPEKDCLEKLLFEAKEKDYKIIQPNRKYTVNNKFIEYASEWNFSNIRKREVKNFKTYSENEKSTEIITVPFEGPLMHKEVITKVGLPEKDFFIFFDDTDYSMRAFKKGFRILLVPNAILYRQVWNEPIHRNEFKFTWREYFFYRNLIHFYNKYNYPFKSIRIKYEYFKIQYKAIKSKKTNTNEYQLFKKAFKDGKNGTMGKEIEF